jgi:hypothetical protein
MHQPSRSVFVTLLAIVQLVVGGLLLLCGAFGMVATVAGDSSATVTISRGGKSTTRVYDTTEEMEKETPGYKRVLLGSEVAGLLLRLAMIAGGIGLLMQRGLGWWLSLVWVLLQLAFQVLTIAWLLMVAMPAANRVVRAVPHDDNHVCGTLANGNTFYHLFWLIFAFGFSVYPLLILILLLLPPVRRATARGKIEPHEETEDRPSRRRRRGGREEDTQEDDR